MDTIGEFLTRVRNAGMAKHEKVDIPASNLRRGLAQILQDNGYIRGFKVVRDGKQGMMRVYLRYDSKGNHMIKNLTRVSKPSRRVYVKAEKVPQVRSGYGLAILSTNQGIKSGTDCSTQKLGGELLCKVW